MSILNFDGVRVKLETGKDDKTLTIPEFSEQGTQNIMQPTEIGESLRELNDDQLDPNTRMSGIDMRTRLHPAEINSVLAMDSLVSLGVLPTRCLAFTRQKKRLAVSLSGKGRDDIVQVVAGKRELDQKMGAGGFMDRMKGMFGGR